jgi:hypothetical protein
MLRWDSLRPVLGRVGVGHVDDVEAGDDVAGGDDGAVLDRGGAVAHTDCAGRRGRLEAGLEDECARP